MADRELTLSRADFAKVRRGARSVPLREPFDLAAWAALPWYSVVTVRERPGSGAMAVRTGPARFTPARGGWHLPVFADAVEADAVGTLLRESVERFATEGFERRTA